MSEKYSIEGYTYPEVSELSKSVLSSGLSVLVLGHPGVGKSTMAKEVARDMGFDDTHIIDIRLAEKDPAELGGCYFLDTQNQEFKLYPPKWVKLACSEPCFILLDEINAGITKLHQSVAYQIILDHKVSDFKFHKDSVVIGLGNLEEDNAIVTPLSSALNNRFGHLKMSVDAKVWCDYALKRGLSPDIIAYIAFKGEEGLYRNDGRDAFPSPRTWEMAARADKSTNDIKTRAKIISMFVGEASSNEFVTFLDTYRKVNIKDVVHKGIIPEAKEDSMYYSLVYGVSSYLNKLDKITPAIGENIGKLMGVLHGEYNVLFLRSIQRKQATELFKAERFRNNCSELTDKIFSIV